MNFFIILLEHIVSIISSLLKNCSGANKQRIISKFTENDFEKIDRLLELYFKYSEEVDKIEKLNDDEVGKTKTLHFFPNKISMNSENNSHLHIFNRNQTKNKMWKTIC